MRNRDFDRLLLRHPAGAGREIRHRHYGFHILLDDEDIVEREKYTPEEFYDKMRAARGIPSTAAITPIQFCEKYCQYVDEAIPMSSMSPSTAPALPPTTTPSWPRGCCGRSARNIT